MSDACCRPDELRDYLVGKTSDTQTELLENHLMGCMKCQSSLEILAEESDSLMHLVAQSIAPVSSLQAHVLKNSQKNSTGHTSREQSAYPSTAKPGVCEPAILIPDHEIMECIGQGGMGSVYRAKNFKLDRQVAIKILKSDRRESGEAVARFAREMVLSAKFNHPCIVKALHAGEQDNMPYLVMELIDGVDLNQLVRRLGPLPVPEACHIVRLAALALQYAHDQQVIHRDVKPSNLMITAEGSVKLLDLGLAQVFELQMGESISRTDQALGTLAYMAPEQLSGRYPVTCQSDIFSLGLTLHELLTGQRPRERPGMLPTIAELRSLRPDVGEDLLALVGDMIAFTPTERPNSMADVESRLSELAGFANLSALVTEYNCWNDRAKPAFKSEFVRAETLAINDQSTDKQLTPSGSHPGSAAQLIPPPVTNQWRNLTMARRLRGLTLFCSVAALLCSVAALLWMAFWPTQSPGGASVPLPPEPRSSPNIPLEIISGEMTVARQLLENGCVSIKNIETAETFELSPGQIELAPGKYQWQYTGPVEFEEDGDEFEVTKGLKRLTVGATLTQPFQSPDLPEQAGASQRYRGHIWRAGWEAGEPLDFGLTLEVLDVSDDPDQPVMTRLRVEVTDLKTNYCETGYLEIDAKKWRVNSELAIGEDSWIEAQSPAIKSYMGQTRSNGQQSLVMRFDRDHDPLRTFSAELIPQRRLSVCDVLSLFFGEHIPAAEPIYNQVRAKLIAKGNRNNWLSIESNSYANELCYVASSRTQGSDPATEGYIIARRTSPQHSPFGFVKVEVYVDQVLSAECVMVKATPPSPKSQASRVRHKLEELRQNGFEGAIMAESKLPSGPSFPNTPHVQPFLPHSSVADTASTISSFPDTPFPDPDPRTATLPGEKNRESIPSKEKPNPPPQPVPTSVMGIDLATLPDKPSFVTIVGSIAHGNDPVETIEATVRMLGGDVIDGREYRWIEVEVNSTLDDGADYWEAARMQIDVQAYQDSRRFVIRRVPQNSATLGQRSVAQAWIAFGDKESVFRVPDDENLEGLLDLRLRLPRKQQFDRIGIVDVLSLLFAAELKPRSGIGRLRATIGGLLANISRQPLAITRTLKTGEVLHCERWVPPIKLPGLNYEIDRNAQIPFGFVSVTLNVSDINIRLALENQRGELPTDFSSSVFGTNENLAEIIERSKTRLQTKPNWRVWTWDEAGKTYKAWAEFGGTVDKPDGQYVLLRNEANQETWVHSNRLTDADMQTVSQGRLWSAATFPNRQQPSLYRVLVQDDERARQLVFRIPAASNATYILPGEPKDLNDRNWLIKLRTARKRSGDPSQSKKTWEAFADHIR